MNTVRVHRAVVHRGVYKNKKINHHVLLLSPVISHSLARKMMSLSCLPKVLCTSFPPLPQEKIPLLSLEQTLMHPLEIETKNRPIPPSTAGMEKSCRFENDIDRIQDLLGPHGNRYRNIYGERILNIMRELGRRSPSNFFDSHGKFGTGRCRSNK